MKIAFVVQRCGKDIFGGAEALILNVAQNLSEVCDVEVLTTRAKDASSWKDYYPSGIQKINKLKIHRFSVDKQRDPKFVPLSRELEKNNEDYEKGIEFLNASGPVCNKLLDFIQKNKDDYDLFIFVGYLYWQTFFGMPLVKEKSILLPTAHDEPWIHFKIFKQVFDLAVGFIFLTNSEKEFVHEKFDHSKKPFSIVGHGMDLNLASKKYKSKIKIPTKYLLYIGRINAGKGCQFLSDYYNKYIKINDVDLKLILLGDQEQKIANSNALIFENLKDDEKFFILQNCKVFVMPSFYESLNIACLEAWLLQKPVIVNGKSKILKEHCLRSNGGLYFEDYHEFSESLTRILDNKQFSNNLGINGEKYVRENYSWKQTRKNYFEFFSKILEKKVD